jgi:hypothetical protein
MESTWMTWVSLPSGWYNPEWMIEMDDQTILAAGRIYSSGQDSTWIANLTPQGKISWIRTLALDENEEFTIRNLEIGANGYGLLSGFFVQYIEEGRISQKTMLAISSDGKIQWEKSFGGNYLEVLPDQSILLRSGFGAEKVDVDGDLVWEALLDFGEKISNKYAELYPSLNVELVHQLPDNGLMFYGTIYDIYWIPVPPDSARSGRMEGKVAYWYAGFSSDGSLLWKHFYELDIDKQWIGNAVVTSDGYLAITGADKYGPQSSAWVRKIDHDGQTMFYKRYLEMPVATLTASPDGGLLLFGYRVIPRESQDNIYQHKLMKVNATGEVAWAREFVDDFKIRGGLPLSDGRVLLTIYYRDIGGIGFARLDENGWLQECPGYIKGDLVTLVDQGLPLYDKASEIPMSLSYQTPEEREDGTPPALSFELIDIEIIEICRNRGE